MGVIVVDTSVLVDHLRGDARATHQLEQASTEGTDVAASVLTAIELLWGMRAPEKRSVRTLLDALTMLPVTFPIAERAGAFARQFRASHTSIDVVDYAIAATAVEHEAVLWTRNIKHFPMLDGLEPPYG